MVSLLEIPCCTSKPALPTRRLSAGKEYVTLKKLLAVLAVVAVLSLSALAGTVQIPAGHGRQRLKVEAGAVRVR